MKQIYMQRCTVAYQCECVSGGGITSDLCRLIFALQYSEFANVHTASYTYKLLAKLLHFLKACPLVCD